MRTITPFSRFPHCIFNKNLTRISLLLVVGLFSILPLLTSATDVGGVISSNSTWSLANSPYVLTADVTVNPGVTLIIEPGVTVEFPNLGFDLVVNGTISAIGSVADTIKFLGIGGFGGGSVYLTTSGSGSQFDFALFDRLGISGSSAYDCALRLDVQASVNNCSFTNNNDDVRALATAVGGFGSSNNIEDVNLFSNSLNASSIWPVVGQPGSYYNFFGDQTLPAGETLTIMPGAEIRLPNLSYDLIINGKLLAVGTPFGNIKFYGAGTFDGGSVAILSPSVGSEIRYVQFDSLGTNGSSAYDCALYLEAETIVSNSTFDNNLDDVRAFSTAVGGFENNNSLEDINLISNSLAASSIWPKADPDGFYYNFFGDQILPVGETLTIMPGAEIRLPNLAYDLIINGQLIAVGTPSDNIKFYGAGTFDGGSVAILSPSVGSVISYAQFDSLGTNGSSAYDCALFLESEAAISNSSFQNNTDDVRGKATAFGGFSNNNNLLDINVLNNSLDTTAIWPDADAGGFHYNLFGDISIPSTDSLILMPGIDVHFGNLSYDLVTNGTLIADGTASDSIRFLGIGSFGGGSVAIAQGSNGSRISYARFDRMGINSSSAYDAGLHLQDFALVSHCLFTNNTNDVIADADKVSGFENTNSLLDINIISNSLNTDSVWPDADADGFYYNLWGDQTVGVDDTLTINPGVDVHFENLAYDLRTNGTLLANGTATDSIRFLGIGTFGGGSVYVGPGSNGSSISYARFDRLGINGSSAYDAGLYLLDVTSVANCQFTNNLNDVIADADKVSGFESSNSLFDINLLTNSLDTNSIWPNADANGFHYNLLGDIIAHPGDTLTIDPDVEVQFPNLAFDLLIDGTLLANGVQGSEVRFIGIGGNGGGSVVIRSPSTGSSFSFCHFENLGINGSSAFDTGLQLENEAFVSNCNFVNNGRDIKGRADAMGGLQNTNTLEDVEFTTGSLGKTSVWPNADVGGFFYRMISDQTVSLGDSLTIEPGVTVDFAGISVDLRVEGTLIASGTDLEPITLNSPITSGGTLVFVDGSTGNFIKKVIIDRLGENSSSAYDSGILVQTPDVTIKRCNIKNAVYGITIDYAIMVPGFQATDPILLRNVIENNDNVGIRVLNGDPLIRYNSIINNTNFGLTNTPGNVQVDACENWWGDPSGPYNAASNPAGLGNAVTDNVLFFNCWLTTPPNTFLSVELTDFHATLSGLNVLLDWSTVSETGHSHFDIEKSHDGISFEYLARVGSIGNEPGITDYQFIDNDPFTGENYYRLKMVDENWFHEYSNVEFVFVEKLSEETLEIFPNPFSLNVEIYLNDLADGFAELTVYDVLGRLQFTQSFENVHNRLVVSELSELPPGNYFIVINTTSGALSQKVVKQ